jgi:hypothetical protein
MPALRINRPKSEIPIMTKDLYKPQEFDEIPQGIRVLEVKVGPDCHKKGRKANPPVFYCTSRSALDKLSKKYGTYDATVVRAGDGPWDSERQGII